MTNKEIAAVFATIADLLEIKGEVIYKILAYRRASQTIAEHGREVTVAWREGQLREIPAVGPAIAEKIDELLSTGKLEFYEKLKREVPPGLAEVLSVPDVGPKKAALFWKQLGITTVAELEQAAREGKLRGLPGLGAKSEAKILAGIAARSRRSTRTPLGQAWPVAQEMLKFLRGLPGVRAAEAAGSLRRMCATIGDLDFLVAADEAEPIMHAFVSHPRVARVLGQGPTKSSVELASGMQADLRVLPLERFGTLLQYFTGSQAHNVKLRELALSQGYSLSDQALTRKSGEEILVSSEAEVYRLLGLAYIPPELREDRGEIQAAARGALPRLVEVRDLQSELHSHSTWSDGTASIRDMAMAARSRGLKCLAVTDHSQSLGVAGGLAPERLRAQRREIDAVQAEMGPGFSLLHGAEVEIRADGRLDYSDSELEDLDIVIASLHTSLRQDRDKVTARLIRAIQNRHVDIIGHPTGRLLPDREGADLDMEAVLHAAAESGVALEINANPARLDLEDSAARRALELGCVLSINTDSHSPREFELAHFGFGTARRAGAAAENVINVWPVEKLLHWLDERDRRVRKASRPAVVEVPPEAEAEAARPKQTAGKPAAKYTAAKKAAAKKAAAKKAAAKKAAVKKTAAKKSAAGKKAGRSAPARRTTSKGKRP